ncbi:molecular chaperone DnaJ, partial [Ralstonia pseudosolanacearum]
MRWTGRSPSASARCAPPSSACWTRSSPAPCSTDGRMTSSLQGPWAVLDIAPTQDARQIRRAYAARLKAVRPDEDAAGFQALREAYEWALAQCD